MRSGQFRLDEFRRFSVVFNGFGRFCRFKGFRRAVFVDFERFFNVFYFPLVSGDDRLAAVLSDYSENFFKVVFVEFVGVLDGYGVACDNPDIVFEFYRLGISFAYVADDFPSASSIILSA